MNEETLSLESFTLEHPTGDLIHGDVRFPHPLGGGRAPAVIICHSFMASKEWGFFPSVAGAIARAGFYTVTFNFSRNGVVGDAQKITDFTSFERNTVSHELEDVEMVMTALQAGHIAGGAADPGRIALMGHSRGAGVAVVGAAADARVKALVTWSAVASFDRWTQHQKRLWRSLGYLPMARDTQASPLRVGIGLLEDLERNKERLDILRAARALRIPWYILHGREDLTVPVREAELLAECSGSPLTTLALLESIGHLYNAASPEEDGYKTLERILSMTIAWLQNNL
jgi:pimeloyl-ACP methyl ester carboxylesterase